MSERSEEGRKGKVVRGRDEGLEEGQKGEGTHRNTVKEHASNFYL